MLGAPPETGQQPNSAPGRESREGGAEAPDDIQPSPSVRRFSRNSEVDYAVVAYNPTSDPKTGRPQLTMQVKLYHDGKILHQLPSRQVNPGAGNDSERPKRLDCAGRLKLTGFPPGDYVMRMVVTDQLANKKYSRAEQWMDFSVR